MPLVAFGVVLLGLWWADIGPFGNLPWWVVAIPFAGAVLWWEFADSSGWTQRRVMDKMERRKAERREKAMEALGLNSHREKQATRAREDAARRTTADPTQAEHPPDSNRRDPRL